MHYYCLLSQLKMSLGTYLKPWALSKSNGTRTCPEDSLLFFRKAARYNTVSSRFHERKTEPSTHHHRIRSSRIKKKTLTNSTSNHSSTFIHQHLSCVSLPTLILLTVLLEKEILPHESKSQKSLDTRRTWLLWIWMAVDTSFLIRRNFPRSQKGQLGKCRLYQHEIDTK